MSSVDENASSPQGFSVYIPFSGAHPCSIDNIYQISQMWSTPAGYKERAVWFNSVFVCFRKCQVLFLGLNSKTLCATVPVVPKTVLPQLAIAFAPQLARPISPDFSGNLKLHCNCRGDKRVSISSFKVLLKTPIIIEQTSTAIPMYR